MFRIRLRNVQHIASLDFSVDLARHGLLAIVGKNGVGKTTLARAIRNLSHADTFATTAGAGIFGRKAKSSTRSKELRAHSFSIQGSAA